MVVVPLVGVAVAVLGVALGAPLASARTPSVPALPRNAPAIGPTIGAAFGASPDATMPRMPITACTAARLPGVASISVPAIAYSAAPEATAPSPAPAATSPAVFAPDIPADEELRRVDGLRRAPLRRFPPRRLAGFVFVFVIALAFFFGRFFGFFGGFLFGAFLVATKCPCASRLGFRAIFFFPFVLFVFVVFGSSGLASSITGTAAAIGMLLPFDPSGGHPIASTTHHETARVEREDRKVTLPELVSPHRALAVFDRPILHGHESAHLDQIAQEGVRRQRHRWRACDRRRAPVRALVHLRSRRVCTRDVLGARRRAGHATPEFLRRHDEGHRALAHLLSL